METNEIKWYKRKELWGVLVSVLSFSPEIIDALVGAGILKEWTLVAKLALPLGIFLKAIGLKKGYQANNLPSGLSRFMDKIPDKITGVRGESLIFKK